ncbi:MAG TPA: peptide deformylase [Tepidisphaeraceae bacterium]|nr:peptide deformylase [Tepidisphaeraceae bacterium]
MDDDLRIILYPDPRLKKVSAPVTSFDDDLKQLAARMFELMRANRGVGLAAPQVGINTRLFVMNPTGEPQDDRVYVNPSLSEPAGSEEAEEGCLSLPGIHVNIDRVKSMRMQAQDLEGNPIDQVETGYVARIWQHEFDHLNGTLLTDRMGAVAKMTHRRVLKELEEKYRAGQGRNTTRPDKRNM